MQLTQKLIQTREASRIIATLSTKEKNDALKKIAKALEKNASRIEKANLKDLKLGEKKGLGDKLDRLKFHTPRILESVKQVKKIISLPNPIGRVISTHKPLAKFSLQKISTPLGVVAMIYESRPNVTIDAITLALKSGNAIVLRGSSEALNSNREIVRVVKASLKNSKIPLDAILFIDSSDRKIVGKILQARKWIDLVIPRGGRGLIDFVAKHSLIPTIETGASVVNLFIDKKANLEKAIKIAINSKTRRVSICNALDTLLIHEKIAKKFLAKLTPLLLEKKVGIHIEKKFQKYFSKGVKFKNANYDKEWLSLNLNIKIVKSIEEAIQHIHKHSLHHTEAIVSEDKSAIEKFLREVDASCVYANLSTQFSDGGEFGLGAEIGISTQKLHTRGPFALEALTTYKWVGKGKGEIRKV